MLRTFGRAVLLPLRRVGVSREPVIIYQVGKVGSRTMLHSLMAAYQGLRLEVPVYHVHVLEKLDEMERSIRRDFAKPVENLAFLEQSRQVRRQIDENPQQHWKLISLVRDPVARNVGSFFQNLHEYMPDWRQRGEAGRLSLDELQEIFLGDASIHVAADWWFDEQLKPLFGIDVFATPFPAGAGYKIYRAAPRAELLLMRLEDMNECAGRAVREFLGIRRFPLHNTNRADEKDYAELYRAFKSKPLPEEYLERMYGTRSARHFYSAEELEGFARRWRG